MRLLLNTHIALWAILDDPRLTAAGATLVSDPGNEIFVSAATIWEIAIKHALNGGRKGDMPIGASQAVDYFRQAGFELLPITPDHAVAAGNLPALHSDPFDRMLVAQALSEPLRLLTHDRQLAEYSDAIMLV